MNKLNAFEDQLKMLMINHFDFPNENMAFVSYRTGRNRVLGGIIYRTKLNGKIYTYDNKRPVIIAAGSLVVSFRSKRRYEKVWSNPDILSQIKIKREVTNEVIELAAPLQLDSITSAVGFIKGVTTNGNVGNPSEYLSRLNIDISAVKGTNQKVLNFSLGETFNK